MFLNGRPILTKKKDHKLEELIEELEEGRYAVGFLYLDTFRSAHLTEAQVQILVDWANGLRSEYSHTSD